MQSRSTGCVCPHSRTVEPRVGRKSELLVRPVTFFQNRFHVVPDLNRDCVGTGPTHSPRQLRDDLLRFDAPVTVYAYLDKERKLIDGSVDREMPAVAIARLPHASNSALNTDPKKQLHQVVDQAAAGRRVINPSLRCLGIPPD